MHLTLPSKTVAVSSRIIGNQKHRAAQWARENFPNSGLGHFGEDFTSLLLEKGLEIQAALFYTDFQPGNSVQMHVAALAGEFWLNRPFLAAAFRYPFIQLGVRRVGVTVESNNSKSLRLVRRAGWTQEGIAREAGGEGIDIIHFGMLKSECRFLSLPEPEIWSVDLEPVWQKEAPAATGPRDDNRGAVGG